MPSVLAGSRSRPMSIRFSAERFHLRMRRHLRESEIHMRRGLAKRAQHTGQNIVSRRPHKSKIERTAHAAAGPLRCQHGFFRSSQNQSRAIQKDLPRRSDLNPPPVAEEQLHQQLLLQSLNLSAQCWLGNAQALGGMPEVQILRHRNKIPQLAQFHGNILMPDRHYWKLPMYWTYQPFPGHSRGMYFSYDFCGS